MSALRQASPVRAVASWPPPHAHTPALGYVFDQQTGLLRTTLITMGIGLAYWAIVIAPQKGKAWQILDAAE